MSMKRTHSNSITAGGLMAAGRACAKQFSGGRGGTAVLRTNTLPAYQPGGELMREGANSTINFWNADRRVRLI
jgi:hypothetical protein